MLVWKLWTVHARMFAVTAILSCVIKIRGLFKSTKWRHFENVKFEALSARRACYKQLLTQILLRIFLSESLRKRVENLGGVREKGYTFVA